MSNNAVFRKHFVDYCSFSNQFNILSKSIVRKAPILNLKLKNIVHFQVIQVNRLHEYDKPYTL